MRISLSEIQEAIQSRGLDGWLFYDFRSSNPLARRILGIPDHQHTSRRWVYFIPATGTPHKLVHRIEDSALDSLPGGKTIYLHWKEFEAGIQDLVKGSRIVAMEYASLAGNPYVSRVDAGTIELVRSFDIEVASSGDLVSQFEATWTEEQWLQHQKASEITNSAFDVAWKLIADRLRAGTGVQEVEVRDAIMDHFHKNNATTYSPPIVGRNAHSGLPHYETGTGDDCLIREGDVVLVDLWAKLDEPNSVYSDLTRMGFAGTEVPQHVQEVFDVVAAARDAGVQLVEEAFSAGRPLKGAEIDDAVRAVIETAGYGQYFTHRTGHSIGQEVHGNGAHLDNLETRDDRQILSRTCFSIEPGIYREEFGVRTEIDVYVDADNGVHVTGGLLQKEVIPILKQY